MISNYTIFSRKNNNLDQAEGWYQEMNTSCPYNFPEYMNILSDHLYDNIELNIFFIKSENGKVFYPFFKRSLKNVLQISQRFHEYSDIIGSWYYGGPLVCVENDKSALVRDYEKAFGRYCAKENIIAEFIRFDPNIENHLFFEKYHDVRLNRQTVYLDLDQDYESIWQKYKGRCRTAIRKAVKNNVVVSEENDPALIDDFVKIYQAEMERKADSRHYFFSSRFFHEIVQKMPDNFKYFFAFYKGTLCGSTIIYCYNDIVYDFLMATSIDFWKYQPNNILLDSAVKWSKSKGFKIFDLMGGRKSVFKFKSSFSDLRKNFYVGRKIYNDAVYSDLEQITARLAGKKYDPDFFPVYRQLEN